MATKTKTGPKFNQLLQDLTDEQQRLASAAASLQACIDTLNALNRMSAGFASARAYGAGQVAPKSEAKPVTRYWSPASRAAAAKRMKAYWAKRRAEKRSAK